MRFTSLLVITIISFVPCFTQAATVTFSMTIMPVRILIVDEQERIIDLFSNVSPDAPAYQLQARRENVHGEQLDVKHELLTAYQQFLQRRRQSVGPHIVSTVSVEQSPDGRWQELTSVMAI
ncbi:MAG: hypothetical protein HY567_01660 [Candidatus Kerfeldbacteria bacterium]|nr:hypothetical protein [Candidatus Kerfeldbacteria bacterium]